MASEIDTVLVAVATHGVPWVRNYFMLGSRPLRMVSQNPRMKPLGAPFGIQLPDIPVEPRYTHANTRRNVDLDRLKRDNRELYRALLKMRDATIEIDMALTRCDIRGGMRNVAESAELATLIEQGARRMANEELRDEARAVREYAGFVGERFHGRCRCDRR